MTIFGQFKNLASAALATVSTVFTREAPTPAPAQRNHRVARSLAKFDPLNLRFWWRSRFLTPHMRHKLANDKGLMVAENPLLRGLIARHFKEFA